MKNLFVFICFFATQLASADVFTLQEAKITYRSFFGGGTDPLITQNSLLPNRTLGKELNLELKSNIFQYLYWNNTVHSMTDEIQEPSSAGQFRSVGLEFSLGVDVSQFFSGIPISFGYYHYSQHLLDTQHSLGHFPVKDGVELNLYLYRRDR